ncbi:MAG TPA: hypothetical protein VL461_00730 [Dictyobacter sp.]|jgi:hypothetical protein|nr:hypothetical protein [Dictyobacter sp.]
MAAISPTQSQHWMRFYSIPIFGLISACVAFVFTYIDLGIQFNNADNPGPTDPTNALNQFSTQNLYIWLACCTLIDFCTTAHSFHLLFEAIILVPGVIVLGIISIILVGYTTHGLVFLIGICLGAFCVLLLRRGVSYF